MDGRLPLAALLRRLAEDGYSEAISVESGPDAMGAELAGLRAVPVAVDDRWRMDLGAIDDDSRGNKGDSAANYVAVALDELLAGKAVTTAETKPYGCSVKYKK